MGKRGVGRRVQRTASEWRGLVEAQRESGLSQAAFCAEHGVVLSSFCKARRRVIGDGSHTAPMSGDFLPVSTTAHDAEAWEVELVISERLVIRLRGA